MNGLTLPPTPANTLVVLLGASEWPNSPAFTSSKAFSNAAKRFTAYLRLPRFFGLPPENLLDLFNSSANASEQLEQMSLFLERRAASLKASQQAVRDVIVYFIGHGGFVGHDSDFYLVHRRTNVDSLRASGISIAALADVLLDKARHARRYVFLDCCFAAAAFKSFQGGPDQVALTKTLDAFHVPTKRSGFPSKGTVLLCSSDQKTPSLLLPDESCTMFSRALLEALVQGDEQRSMYLSLRDVKDLAQDWLSTLPERNAPRPALLSPDQSEGDVADIPFFPNPGARQQQLWRAEEERRRQAEEQARKEEEEKRRLAEEAERARLATEKRMQNIAKQGSPMPSQTFPPPSSSHPAQPVGIAPPPMSVGTSIASPVTANQHDMPAPAMIVQTQQPAKNSPGFAKTGVNRSRPLGVTVGAIIMFIYSILYMIFGIQSIIVSYVTGFGLILIILGIIEIFLIWGLWTLRKWAYGAAITYLIFQGLAAFLLTHTIIGLIVGLVAFSVLIYLLVSKNVRAAFRK